MTKPSPQFVHRLETELRTAYRIQYAQKNRWSLANTLKIGVPAFAAGFGMLLLALNFLTPPTTSPINEPELQASIPDVNTVSFNVGTDEEEILNQFETDEFKEMENGIKLAAAGNF